MDQQFKNLLTIVLPSYFNAKLLEFWLNYAKKDRLFDSINIFIAITESKENIVYLTKNFSFNNVRFFLFDKDKTMEEKVFSISKYLNSKYVYLCGDGVLPNISNIYQLIENKNDDVFIVFPEKSHFNEIFLKNKLNKCIREKIFYYRFFKMCLNTI